MTAVLLTAVLPALAEHRGGIAFHYATPLSAHELEWYSRFEVLVTHDPLPRAQVDALHRRGTKLVLYQWAVAFYATRSTKWDRALPHSALLNQRPLRGHLGAADADAFYFDPATREHQLGRAAMLGRRLRANGYDGVFLDTTTSESVHPEALAEFRLRHPETTYDEAFEEFLRNLRRELRHGLIVTNQGYRSAARVLPYVDWDVTESLITYPRNGRFVFRPWNEPGDRWNSTSFLMRNLIEPVRKEFPSVRFAHINYLDAPDERSIADIVAIARLYDADAYVSLPDITQPVESELYFLDLGEAQPRVELAAGAYRFFERGTIAVNAGGKPMRIRRGGRTIVVPPATSVIVRQTK
ncbi:MAG TPA: hypothetical protein VF824_00940 [Thermoanaerobaculia bacterium]|jgi:hypothetical protein